MRTYFPGLASIALAIASAFVPNVHVSGLMLLASGLLLLWFIFGDALMLKDAPTATLRDQFAMAALTGLIAQSAYGTSAEFARQAGSMADAMMAERQKGGAA
ncbi:hypothetical protein GTZ99_12290 [Novosphingobium sp. FSY-8]|uniref:Uncharacterized protein n=1 Tax=Novosphingobium ovatum TaxID=1908523 RepID=A0ABW9XFL3_9SPHN|nr:hypothetical protein [Novosphingobium ovatum]NBC37329.1 hypothetical protein [Novosphingobium ovatum]